jgi:hypothetical protein
MEIRSSVEVRWFLEDTKSTEATAARAWFADVKAQKPREDRYLITGRDDLGFKARVDEGGSLKLETKYLLGSLGPALLHERIVGNVERWRKLSLAATDPTLEKDGEWFRVSKTRRMRKYACEGRGVQTVDASANPAAGALVELTELGYDGREALTIAVDAFGSDEQVLDVLLRVCAVAFESADGLRLGFDRSASYPRWLARGSTLPLAR